MEFNPKCGIVEPGVTRSVQMNLVGNNVTFARLLVKMVALHRNDLLSSFQDSWSLGAKKGVVKKVVDIRNKAFTGVHGDEDDMDNFSESVASEGFHNIASPMSALSPTEGLLSDGENEREFDLAQQRSSEKEKKYAPMSPHTPEQEAMPVTLDAEDANSVLSPHDDMDSEVGTSGFKPIISTGAGASLKSKAVFSASLVKLDDATRRQALPISSVRPLSNKMSNVGFSDSNVVEVKGGQALSQLHLVPSAVAIRSLEVYNSRSLVTAVEISNTKTPTTFKECIGCVFNENPSDEVERMRAVMLEANLRHIIMDMTCLLSVDTSINRFNKLITLDLSDNDIQHVDEGLQLPLLQRLDIARNRITSVTFLENLVSLKAVNLSNNRIKSLSSITGMVALASTLTSVDFSGNPCSTDQRYASLVVSSFPRLTSFDSRDLQAFGPKGSYTNSRFSHATPGGVGSARKIHSVMTTPALPSEFEGSSRGEEESKTDADFERRLKHALKSHRRPGAAAPDVDEVDAATTEEDIESSLLEPHIPASVAKSVMPPPPPVSSTKAQPYSASATAQTTSSKLRLRNHKHNVLEKLSGQKSSPRARSLSPEMKAAAMSPTHSQNNSLASQHAPDLSHISQDIASNRQRRKSYGIVTGHNHLQPSSIDDSGYLSDPSGTGLTRKSTRGQAIPSDKQLTQMQEDPRYGIYHPRYRVPKKTFGYSKPFLHQNKNPTSERSTADVPLFDKYVQRMRDGFQKLPSRGTFNRASKGLPAEWYPMDVNDVEAIRRQGYFHETIGDIQKGSYNDVRSRSHAKLNRSGITGGSHTLNDTLNATAVEGQGIYEGTVHLSPRNSNRRQTIVQHQSRQYKTMDGSLDTEPPDDFSDYKKWYPTHEIGSIIEERSRASIHQGRSQEATQPPHGSGGRAVAPSWAEPVSLNTSMESQPGTREGRQGVRISSAGAASSVSAVNRSLDSATTAGSGSSETAEHEEKKLAEYLQWLETQGGGQGKQHPSTNYPFHKAKPSASKSLFENIKTDE